MLISCDFSEITGCRSMQGLFQVADNIAPRPRDRDAVVTSQCIDGIFILY